MKVCNKCGIEKPYSDFRKDKYRKDGYTSRCKHCIDNAHILICECCGKEFTAPSKKQRFCSYECMGKNNVKRVELNCEICGKEFTKIKSEYERNSHHYCSKECRNKAQSIMMSGENHFNWDRVNIECSNCGNILSKTRSEINSKEHHYCSVECLGEHRKTIYRGELSPTWKGGLTSEYELLMSHLRRGINQWRQDSIDYHDGKCVISGEDSECVHHLYGMDLIIDETFKLTGIERKDKYSDYTSEELEQIKNTCTELHYKYGYGVCLTKDLHKKFHIEYGYGGNTPDQFEQFKNDELKSVS